MSTHNRHHTVVLDFAPGEVQAADVIELRRSPTAEPYRGKQLRRRYEGVQITIAAFSAAPIAWTVAGSGYSLVRTSFTTSKLSPEPASWS